MSLEQTNQPVASLSRQDQIHWGILFLSDQQRTCS